MSTLVLDRGNGSPAKTSGAARARVIPLVVNSSGRYERAEDLVGLWAAVIALGTLLAFFLGTPLGEQSPQPERVQSSCLLPVLVTITAGFVAGTLIVTQMFWIRRLFVPKAVLARNVDERATQAFKERRIEDRTRPAVIVFVSVFERMARIVVDESLAANLPHGLLCGLRRDLEQAIRSRQLDTALPAAVGELSQLLSPLEPAKAPEDKSRLLRPAA